MLTQWSGSSILQRMETITLNRSIGRTRRETLGGRDYIVAPLSMLVPGVLNGSRGPLLYPPELVNRNPAVWNHMPIVVYHPMELGKPTSARDPYILNKQGIGFVFKSRENGRAEGWFDVENTKRIDPRVYDSLIKNQPMELSTGLFTKNKAASPGASFRGRKYVEVVTDFTPDHLAILPDQKGACSMKDGCGMLINKEDGETILETPQRKSRYRQLVETLQEVLNGSANQPRDSQGRWSGGGGGKSSSTKANKLSMAAGGSVSTNLSDKAIRAAKQGDSARAVEYHSLAAQRHKEASEDIMDPVRSKKHEVAAKAHLAAAEVHSQAKSGSATDSHETVKQMQKPGNTTKLASALTKAEGIAKPKAGPSLKEHATNFSAQAEGYSAKASDKASHLKAAGEHRFAGRTHSKVADKEVDQAAKKSHSDKASYHTYKAADHESLAEGKKPKYGLIQNSEGSQFGKPHNTVKEKPNMAKQRKQVNNEEVELTDDDREELIDLIVDNCACEEAQDRETLNNLSDKTLSKLALNAVPPQFMKKKVVAEEEESETEMEDEEEVPVKNSKNKKAVTVNKSNEQSPKLDAKTQFLVNYAERKMQEEKDLLIEKLTANVSEEDMEDMEDMVETLNEEPIEKLERMVKLLPKEEKREPVQNNRNQRGRSNLREEAPESKGRNFTGAGGALPRSQAKQVNNSRNKADEEDPLAGPLESPTINYADVAGFQNGNFIHRNNLGSMQASAN